MTLAPCSCIFSISDLWFSNVAMKGKKKNNWVLKFVLLKTCEETCVEVTVCNIEELKPTAWIMTSKTPCLTTKCSSFLEAYVVWDLTEYHSQINIAFELFLSHICQSRKLDYINTEIWKFSETLCFFSIQHFWLEFQNT